MQVEKQLVSPPAEARPRVGRDALVEALSARPALIVVALFVVASALYALFLFPWYQMDHFSLQQLKTRGKGLDQAYLPFDSGGYLDSARGSLGSVLRSFVEVAGMHFGIFSNVTLRAIGYVALAIAPRFPYAVIAAFNYVLLVWAAFHYRAVARRYGVDARWFLALLLLNPLVLFCLWTLNKEAIGLFLVGGLLRYRLERKWWGFAALLALALYTRNIFFFFGLVLLFLPFLYELRLRGRRFRVRAGYVLVAASLLVPLGLVVTHDQPFGSEFGPLDLVARVFHQQTQRILSFSYQAERLPFGYLFAWPIVTTINLASPALNYRYWADNLRSINVATLLLQLSSVIFVALLTLAYRARPRFGLFAIEPLRLFFLVTLISSVYPISQHRYLLPFYPLLVLTYLIATGRGPRPLDRGAGSTPLAQPVATH